MCFLDGPKHDGRTEGQCLWQKGGWGWVGKPKKIRLRLPFSKKSLAIFDKQWGKRLNYANLTAKDMKSIREMQQECLQAAEDLPLYKKNTADEPVLTEVSLPQRA